MTTADAGTLARTALRTWLQRGPGMGHPVRTECWLTGLSAATHRLLKFGVEDGFRHYGARELAHFQLMVAGGVADDLLRSTFTRAIIEGDVELGNRLAEMPQVADLVQWARHLDSVDAAGAGGLLAAMTAGSEELSTARLVLGRRLPALLDVRWLDEVDAGQPIIAYHLAAAIAGARPDLATAVLAFLARRSEVLVAGESDALLAPLVRHSTQAPQASMAPFSGYYGDGTLVAAAEWHLEHDQYAAALELADRLGRFSRLRHQARLVAGIALVGLGRTEEALARRQHLADAGHADVLTLYLAEGRPQAVPTAEVVAIMDRCPTAAPERFFRGLRCLLGRRDLATTREVCRRNRERFSDHPQLEPMMTRVLG
jgi:hypothetical protein